MSKEFDLAEFKKQPVAWERTDNPGGTQWVAEVYGEKFCLSLDNVATSPVYILTIPESVTIISMEPNEIPAHWNLSLRKGDAVLNPLFEEEVNWQSASNLGGIWSAVAGGRSFLLQVQDFPDEPLYGITPILSNSKKIYTSNPAKFEIDDRPSNWTFA